MNKINCIKVNGRWFNVALIDSNNYYIYYYGDNSKLQNIAIESVSPEQIYILNLEKPKTKVLKVYKLTNNEKRLIVNYLLNYRMNYANSYPYKLMQQLSNKKRYLKSKLKKKHILTLNFNNLDRSRWIIENGRLEYIVGQSQNEEMLYQMESLLEL